MHACKSYYTEVLQCFFAWAYVQYRNHVQHYPVYNADQWRTCGAKGIPMGVYWMMSGWSYGLTQKSVRKESHNWSQCSALQYQGIRRRRDVLVCVCLWGGGGGRSALYRMSHPTSGTWTDDQTRYIWIINCTQKDQNTLGHDTQSNRNRKL